MQVLPLKVLLNDVDLSYAFLALLLMEVQVPDDIRVVQVLSHHELLEHCISSFVS